MTLSLRDLLQLNRTQQVPGSPEPKSYSSLRSVAEDAGVGGRFGLVQLWNELQRQLSGAGTSVDVVAYEVTEHGGTQESGNDEFYIGLVWVRSTPGVAGTTTCGTMAELSEIDISYDESTQPIPESMGKLSFADVRWSTQWSASSGRMPQVLVVLSAVFESDWSGLDSATNMFSTTVDGFDESGGIKLAIAELVSSTWFRLDSPTLAADVALMCEEIHKAVVKEFFSDIKFWMRPHDSDFPDDEDDFIGFEVTVFLMANARLWEMMKPTISTDDFFLDCRRLLVGDTFAYKYTGQGQDVTFTVRFRVSG